MGRIPNSARSLWLAALVFTGCPRARGADAALGRDAAVGLEASTRALDAGHDPGVPRARTPDEFAPLATLTDRGAGAVLDSTERVRFGDGIGGTVRPGRDAPAVAAAAPGAGLYAGDRLETTEGGASLQLADGTQVELRARSRVIVPPFGGSDLVITRGAIRAVRPAGVGKPALVLDGPGARALLESAGTVWFVVADDGRTLVISPDATLRAAPSPLPPASTLGARIDPRRHGLPGHPISLDVEVHDPLGSSARPLEYIVLAPDQPLALAPDGRVDPAGVPHSAREPDVLRWRAEVEIAVLRPGGHEPAITQISRAGAGDLADARAIVSVLRIAATLPGAWGPDAGPTHGDGGARETPRERLEAQLSAALGRAQARADRGRTLAVRGGDVTPLVALAPLEQVISLARDVLPIRTPVMLDSDERRRVP